MNFEAHCDELRSEWNEEDSLMQHLRQLHGRGARLLGEAEAPEDAIFITKSPSSAMIWSPSRGTKQGETMQKFTI